MNEKGQCQDSLSKACKAVGQHWISWDRNDTKQFSPCLMLPLTFKRGEKKMKHLSKLFRLKNRQHDSRDCTMFFLHFVEQRTWPEAILEQLPGNEARIRSGMLEGVLNVTVSQNSMLILGMHTVQHVSCLFWIVTTSNLKKAVVSYPTHTQAGGLISNKHSTTVAGKVWKGSSTTYRENYGFHCSAF